jgi:uncharacterized membrane protein YobD (UPF0266 family)
MELLNVKNIAGVVAIVLTFAAYTPYFLDLLKGKTKPHIFSWFIWMIVTSIIYALQVSAGAGFGSLVTLAVAIISLFIFILGFQHGNKNIKKSRCCFHGSCFTCNSTLVNRGSTSPFYHFTFHN